VPASLRPLSSFVALALATHLQSNSELLKVRLGLYEILANVLEHGRMLRPGASLEVGLALEPDAVRGWIRDECARFDPRAWPSVPVADLVSGRSTRGYGIHLVRQILGTLEHRFDGNGNTLTFRKEIPNVTTTDEQVLFSSETFKVVRRPNAPDGGFGSI
jgi:anti-sigma regulatory factor (Ser/Thr protein kinase)